MIYKFIVFQVVRAIDDRPYGNNGRLWAAGDS